MRGRSNASLGNAVVSAVIDAAALYRVPCYRMNSRTVMVADARKPGGVRPLSFGEWIDRHGVRHTGGMPDLLLTPAIRLGCQHVAEDEEKFNLNRSGAYHPVTVVLWVECKAGSGRLSREQMAFRDDVHVCGASWIHAHDSASAVMEWFKANGVRR